jgi:hypothetical protein
VDFDGLEVRHKDGGAKRSVQRVQMVYFDCEFPHSRHVIPDLVPYTVQRAVAREIDIEQGAP